ncbi:MAG: glycosyltransferase family 9 protein [Bdellovibrionaceae bacterium]|nr:glycosyltransferase family 9 protein [Pseudobdellovibrionaceae bacterium]
MKKVLIIRLSSLGDILQCLPAADLIKQEWPDCQLHWCVKKDFASSLKPCSSINQIHIYDKNTGLWNFMKMSWKLRQENYTHIYDAHSNLRSHLASIILRLSRSRTQFIRRSKQRIQRWLLFQFRISLLPQPFRGAESFVTPLKKWKISIDKWPSPSATLNLSDSTKNILFEKHLVDDFVLLAPSAAWELKRWPIEHWKKLLSLQSANRFVIVGGPHDDFCQEIASNNKNVVNLSGKLNWDETFELVNYAKGIVSGDTGVLHMADYLHKPTLALMGPTAFGFPSSPNSQILEVQLKCRPCTKDGRGRCHNSVYKKCMMDITPELVSEKINEAMA